MKFLGEKKGNFKCSFDRDELRDILTSLSLIHKGIPKKDLGLLGTKSRIKSMIDKIKQELEKTIPLSK